MLIQCPHCRQTCETEQNLEDGQHVVCPFCAVKFSYYKPRRHLAGTKDANQTLADGKRKRGRRSGVSRDKIAILAVVLLIASVFIGLGIPRFLEYREAELARRKVELARQEREQELNAYKDLKMLYERTLRNNDLREFYPATGWMKTGSFTLMLNGRGCPLSIQWIKQTDEVVYPGGVISAALASELVTMRRRIAEFECRKGNERLLQERKEMIKEWENRFR